MSPTRTPHARAPQNTTPNRASPPPAYLNHNRDSPNWLLPAQSHCRDSSAPGCHWRGEIGTYWGDDCSDGTPWAAWHEGYLSFSMHYARLAEAWGVDALLLSHELYLPSVKCPARWAALLAAVRGAFSGAVSSVLPVNKGADPAAEMPWAMDLDFLGVDCYFVAPLPAGSVPDKLGATWLDVDQATMDAAGEQLMPGLAAFSAALGSKPIVCTELGTSSRPWSYATWGGQTLPCPEDCSVWDQCVSIRALEIAYTWWLRVYYAQPWFDGFLFWDWRADPSSGGLSDNGLSPQAKPSVTRLLKAFWTTNASSTSP